MIFFEGGFIGPSKLNDQFVLTTKNSILGFYYI